MPGAVTIATNMAGRGTDIQLGGNVDMRVRQVARGAARRWASRSRPSRRWRTKAEIEAEIEDLKEQALAAGGLFVLGTERHESRRIDNQLRGRTGRQGDPGHSKFFLSCEDDLLRIFAGERLDSIMRTFGVQEGEAITHKWLNSAIATAQKRVEQRNYEIRKNLLKYDDVVNDQRKAVFEQRQEFMDADGPVRRSSASSATTPSTTSSTRHLPPKAYAEQWDVEGLDEHVQRLPGPASCRSPSGRPRKASPTRRSRSASSRPPTPAPPSARQMVGDHMRTIEKSFLLQTIDLQWREHLMHLDHLRNVIGLRGYGQRDPLNEYKTEAFSLFEKLLVDLRQNVTRWLMTVEFQFEEPPPPAAARPDLRGAPGPADRRERGRARLHCPTASRPSSAQALPVSALPDGWEAHRPQPALPLRLRQEVQALPRRAGLTGAPTKSVAGRRLQVVDERAGLGKVRRHAAPGLRRRTAGSVAGEVGLGEDALQFRKQLWIAHGQEGDERRQQPFGRL